MIWFRLSADGSSYGSLADFLAEQVFGRWDLVLYYDLARGLRAFAGRDGARLKEMVVRANEKVGDLALARKDSSTAFALLDRFVQNNIMAGDESVSAAILIDHASFLLPSGEPGRLSPAASQQVVTLLNWAASPHVKRLNMAMVLMDESAAALSERITSNPYISDIEVPMPDEAARARFLHYALEGRDLHLASDYSEAELARLTAGISCVDINVMVQSAFESGHRLDAARMRGLKKELIERQCRGLLEFMEPKWNTDVLVGHAPVKQRLREDAQLLQRGDTRNAAHGVSGVRSGGNRKNVSGAVHGRRNGRALRHAEEFPLQIRRRNGGEPGAGARRITSHGTRGGGDRRSRRRAWAIANRKAIRAPPAASFL